MRAFKLNLNDPRPPATHVLTISPEDLTALDEAIVRQLRDRAWLEEQVKNLELKKS